MDLAEADRTYCKSHRSATGGRLLRTEHDRDVLTNFRECQVQWWDFDVLVELESGW